VTEQSRIDTAVMVGSVRLPHAVMTASGTSGHGAEFADYGDLSSIGAVVVKSLSADPWTGNPPPRVHPVDSGMINAVGLQGPGVAHWASHDLPALAAARANAVVSIWGRSVADYERAADALADVLSSNAHADIVVAVEVNLSCPNMAGHGIFAHDADMSRDVVARCRAALPRPVWAKLSPNTDRLVDIAGVVFEAGAEAVTLINTVTGMALDPDTGRPALGNGGGGLSGRAIHPVAVRAVFDVHRAHPTLPIVGVGGVSDGWSAAELMLAGASAVQVGTASFADPRAVFSVASSLERWAADAGHGALSDLTGRAHTGGIHP